MNEHHDQVGLLGDRLEIAVARQVRAGEAWGRRAVVGLVAAGVAVACALGALALSGRSDSSGVVADGGTPPAPVTDPALSSPPPTELTPDVVAQGMVDGAMVFAATDPMCTTGDGVAFSCVLARLPTAEVFDDHTGMVQTFVDGELRVAGGCAGQDRSGRRWTCLAGEAAVEAGYLAVGLLGEPQPVPGRG